MAKLSTSPPVPDPIDVAVGLAVRQRRVAMNASQTDLARAIGVTFQQVQKYERGANRFSASALTRAAEFLGCHPGDLLPASTADVQADQTPIDNTIAEIIRACRIIDTKGRRLLLSIARELGRTKH